jgi:hypothetical protein
MTDEDITNKAIAANLEALERLLYNAHVCASEAVVAMKLGERNGAIGAALYIEDMLKQAAALHGAAVALHRGR